MWGRTPWRRGRVPRSRAWWTVSTRASAGRGLGERAAALPGGWLRVSLAALRADAEPVGGRRPRHQAGDGDPGTGGLAGEQVIATLLGLIENPAELALEAVDDGGHALGVDEIVVGLNLEIPSSRFQPFEFFGHHRILRNYVR